MVRDKKIVTINAKVLEYDNRTEKCILMEVASSNFRSKSLPKNYWRFKKNTGK